MQGAGAGSLGALTEEEIVDICCCLLGQGEGSSGVDLSLPPLQMLRETEKSILSSQFLFLFRIFDINRCVSLDATWYWFSDSVFLCPDN